MDWRISDLFRNIFASEEHTSEEFNVIDPQATDKSVNRITLAYIPPTEDLPTADVTLYWTDSDAKLFEKRYESSEEALQAYQAIQADLKEVQSLTQSNQFQEAGNIMASLIQQYSTRTDDQIDNAVPVEGAEEVPAGKVLPTLFEKSDMTPIDYVVSVAQAAFKHGSGPLTPEKLHKYMEAGFNTTIPQDEVAELYEKVKRHLFANSVKNPLIKEGGATVQNLFFDTIDELKEYQEKMKELNPEGDELPGDFDMDLGTSEEEPFGPPSQSYEDMEEEKAEEQEALTDRIEKEVEEQIESQKKKMISSTFGPKEETLVNAMRDMGRTWEEISEYFVKSLKFDKESVAAYIDSLKGTPGDLQEPIEKEPESEPIPNVSPEVHDQLVDEILEEPKSEPESVEIEKQDTAIAEIEKQDGEIKKVAQNFTVEDARGLLKTYAHERPEEMIQRLSDTTVVDMFNQLKGGVDEPLALSSKTDKIKKKAQDPLEETPGEGFESQEQFPRVDFPESPDDNDQSSVMEPTDRASEPVEEPNPGDYVYVASDLDSGQTGFTGVFVKKDVEEDKEYAVVKPKGKEAEIKVPMYRVTKAKQDSLKQIKADLIQLEKEILQKEAAPPTTEEETKVVFKPELKKAPVEKRKQAPIPANEEIDAAYRRVQTTQMNLAAIERTATEIRAEAAQKIKELEQQGQKSQLLQDLDNGVLDLMRVLEPLKGEVVDVGDKLITYSELHDKEKEKWTYAQTIQKIYEKFPEAEEYIEKAKNGLQSQAKKIFKRVLEWFPKKSKLSKRDVSIEADVSSFFDKLTQQLTDAYKALQQIPDQSL